MKKILMTIVAVAGAFSLFAQMPRSEWHAKVGDCALDPALLKSTIAQLSSEDKTAFVAEVNAAIAKMPGSDEVKGAAFLNANRAAVAGAGKEDRMAVLAEVFATVPVEHLTVINEEFAKVEFAKPSTMGSAAFSNLVVSAMAQINKRTAAADSGAVRSAFAGLMFVRAAGGDGATDTVLANLPSDVQAEARESWYPSALDPNSSYDSMLTSAQAGEEPDHSVVVSISRTQIGDSMLSDLQSSGTTDANPGSTMVASVNAADSAATENAGGDTSGGEGAARIARDRLLNPELPMSAVTGNPSDSGGTTPNPYYRGGGRSNPEPQPEPNPYWLQNL